MATKLPFGEIKSSLLASSREECRPHGWLMCPAAARRAPGAQRLRARCSGLTHILCPLQFLLEVVTLCAVFSLLTSRRLLRAVKCLLPVYCVSNCSLGGEIFPSLPRAMKIGLRVLRLRKEQYKTQRITDHAVPRSPSPPALSFYSSHGDFPSCSQTRVIHHYGLGDCWYFKSLSLPQKTVWLASQVELSDCTQRQVIDLINVYTPIYFSFLQGKLQIA